MNRGDHLAEEALGEPLTRRQQRHVDACWRCAQQRRAVLAVREAVGTLPRTAAPPAAALALLDAPAQPPVQVRRMAYRLGVAALIAATVGAAFSPALFWRAPFGAALAQEIALDHLHYERNAAAAEVSGNLEQIESFFAQSLHRAPQLAPLEGTDLIGGKRCRIGGQWSALVWLMRAGHWLSFFSLPQAAVATRGCRHASGVSVCGIPDARGGSRVLVGKLPDTELLRLLDESTDR